MNCKRNTQLQMLIWKYFNSSNNSNSTVEEKRLPISAGDSQQEVLGLIPIPSTAHIYTPSPRKKMLPKGEGKESK